MPLYFVILLLITVGALANGQRMLCMTTEQLGYVKIIVPVTSIGQITKDMNAKLVSAEMRTESGAVIRIMAYVIEIPA